MSHGVFLALTLAESKALSRAAKLASTSRTNLVRVLIRAYLDGTAVAGLPKLVRTRTVGGRLRLEADPCRVGDEG
jgi:hypothetical protein